MSVRIIAATIVATCMLAACSLDDATFSEPQTECPPRCDDGYVPVERCPAFSDCLDADECPDFVCAREEDVSNTDNEQPSPPPPDCDDSVQCPEGSIEVFECPDDGVCTTISLCDEYAICQEQPELCDDIPRCPDDEYRPVDHCEGQDDNYCSSRPHCSGPVNCLECHDGLPESCPESADAVDDPSDCDESGITCEIVETCEATLHCASSCIDEALCPESMVDVDECDGDDGPDCLEIPACDDSRHCAAPDDDCDDVPTCPADYDEVDTPTCVDDFENCHVEAACRTAVTCLPS